MSEPLWTVERIQSWVRAHVLATKLKVDGRERWVVLTDDMEDGMWQVMWDYEREIARLKEEMAHG